MLEGDTGMPLFWWFPDHHEENITTTSFFHDEPCPNRPRTIKLSNYGLKPLESWAQYKMPLQISCLGVLVRVLLLWRGTMTMETYKVSEVQFIIITVWNVAACRQTWRWKRSWEFYILIHRQQNETVWYIRHSFSIGDLKAHPHSDTLSPTRPHLL